ncbi:Hypothetical protein NGAL_HAMBI2566_31710 [Neorhizobium galegae bv. orientalis]|nr:Hypothetical protein NGAL_HAMBI2566_31710 [Neorhizobium galegae bv. orientalis]
MPLKYHPAAIRPYECEQREALAKELWSVAPDQNLVGNQKPSVASGFT